jgi:hypothetical protein
MKERLRGRAITQNEHVAVINGTSQAQLQAKNNEIASRRFLLRCNREGF